MVQKNNKKRGGKPQGEWESIFEARNIEGQDLCIQEIFIAHR